MGDRYKELCVKYKKTKVVLFAIAWAVLVIAITIVSGIVTVVSGARGTEARLIQATFAFFAAAVQIVYLLKAKRLPGLFKTSKLSVSQMFFYYSPCILTLLTMVICGISLANIKLSAATFLFTIGVGISEELCFRKIGLAALISQFHPSVAILISAVIFGLGHSASAFTESSAVMVMLNVINAFLFGWLAAEVMWKTGRIIPLILFHAFFDFLTYSMMTIGTEEVIVYAIRGTIMCLASIFMFIHRRNRNCSVDERGTD